MKEEKKKRGGARKGAGRKPFGETRKINVSVRISPDAHEILQKTDNKSRYVDEAIIEKDKRQEGV